MNENTLKRYGELDEHTETGALTAPENLYPNMNIRAILAKTKELGRSLTVEEAEEFIIA